ncbi:unnamed protein product [Microthlaspi erraticum]|uniref:SNF2 N-terminal domain-containing protein n=1 Tax=Microthlaspi erraticum TaxID=1685480 RepID=A0A6D2L6E0_9BRAS|nr:unnamed protein product [Microthlaspi erraticum]CAA7055462.1 unnamed protein product [Microthlaspi erraticum]
MTGPTEVPSHSTETIKIPTAHYEFGANYFDPQLMLVGRVMTHGKLNAGVKADLKAKAQLTNEPHFSHAVFNFAYMGSDYSALIGATYIQSVTPRLSLGGEVFWAGVPRKSGIGYAARYETVKDKLIRILRSSSADSSVESDDVEGDLMMDSAIIISSSSSYVVMTSHHSPLWKKLEPGGIPHGLVATVAFIKGLHLQRTIKLKLDKQTTLLAMWPPLLLLVQGTLSNLQRMVTLISSGSVSRFGGDYSSPAAGNKSTFGDRHRGAHTEIGIHRGINGVRILPPSMTHGTSASPLHYGGSSDPVHRSSLGEDGNSEKDETLIYQAALQDLNQPKTEVDLRPGTLSVPPMRHQEIALAWMFQKETESLNCSGGIFADDQGLGKTVSTIALILKQKFESQLNSELKISSNSETKVMTAGGSDENGSSDMENVNWARELDEQVSDECKLSVLVYHGVVTNEVPKRPLVDEDANDEKNTEKRGLASGDSMNSSNDTTIRRDTTTRTSSDEEVEKLKAEVVALARRADLSELELQSLRKQIRKDEAEIRNKLHFEGSDPQVVLEATQEELDYEKDLNSNLRLQLEKTQDSNTELILDVQDLEAMLGQKRRKRAVDFPRPRPCEINTEESRRRRSCTSETDEEDEDQKALDELVKGHMDAKEAHVLERRITDLYNEIEIYKRDKEDLEIQEQIKMKEKALEASSKMFVEKEKYLITESKSWRLDSTTKRPENLCTVKTLLLCKAEKYCHRTRAIDVDLEDLVKDVTWLKRVKWIDGDGVEGDAREIFRDKSKICRS